ncbi:glycosyltransferase family 2 protein [Turicibacter bilis]|uniref:glycosyltransferase family 2 protein n=1 Tax=Turicibacter bilis TaxID=2735723 RepID=UPI0031BAED2A
MHNLISVIVPVYNVEDYLERCINSIINQTYTNLEIILVNDGSTDSSGIICDQYSQIDSRIRVIHKKNGGLSDARNVGLDVATGEFISFIDSDDWISLTMFSEMVSQFTDTVDIVSAKFIETDGIVDYALFNDTNNVMIFSGEEALKAHLNGQYFYISVWNKLYRRDLFKQLRFPVGRLAEDLYTTHKLLCQSRQVVFVDKTFIYYFQREGSIMNRAGKKLIFDIYEGTKEQYQYLKSFTPVMKEENDRIYAKCLLKTYSYYLLYYPSEKDILCKIKREIKSLKKEDVKVYGATKLMLNLYHMSPWLPSLILKLNKII